MNSDFTIFYFFRFFISSPKCRETTNEISFILCDMAARERYTVAC